MGGEGWDRGKATSDNSEGHSDSSGDSESGTEGVGTSSSGPAPISKPQGSESKDLIPEPDSTTEQNPEFEFSNNDMELRPTEGDEVAGSRCQLDGGQEPPPTTSTVLRRLRKPKTIQINLQTKDLPGQEPASGKLSEVDSTQGAVGAAQTQTVTQGGSKVTDDNLKMKPLGEQDKRPNEEEEETDKVELSSRMFESEASESDRKQERRRHKRKKRSSRSRKSRSRSRSRSRRSKYHRSRSRQRSSRYHSRSRSKERLSQSHRSRLRSRRSPQSHHSRSRRSPRSHHSKSRRSSRSRRSSSRSRQTRRHSRSRSSSPLRHRWVSRSSFLVVHCHVSPILGPLQGLKVSFQRQTFSAKTLTILFPKKARQE